MVGSNGEAGSDGRARAAVRNPWRVVRWGVVALLLATPLAMMQVSDEWNWDALDFVFAAVMMGGVAALYDLAEWASGSRAYRAGVAAALLTSFVTVWAVFVRDDDTGMQYFLVVMAAMTGAFAAGFRAGGMARAALGTGVMQALLGIAIATAPVTAHVANGPVRALATGAFLAACWLFAAACFHIAARAARG